MQLIMIITWAAPEAVCLAGRRLRRCLRLRRAAGWRAAAPPVPDAAEGVWMRQAALQGSGATQTRLRRRQLTVVFVLILLFLVQVRIAARAELEREAGAATVIRGGRRGGGEVLTQTWEEQTLDVTKRHGIFHQTNKRQELHKNVS